MDKKHPMDEVLDEFKKTPGVEVRPTTETDKARVREVFKGLGVDVSESKETKK